MGQKVNPHGLRVGVIKDWDSRWFVKDNEFGDTLVSDYNLRKYLKKTLYAAGVSKIEIERDASRVRVHIHCAKPGIVIGKGGAEIEKLRLSLVEFSGPFKAFFGCDNGDNLVDNRRRCDGALDNLCTLWRRAG